MERKPGECFDYNGQRILTYHYKTTRNLIYPCNICTFGTYGITERKFAEHCSRSKLFRGQCLPMSRVDKQRVIFFTKGEYLDFKKNHEKYLCKPITNI